MHCQNVLNFLIQILLLDNTIFDGRYCGSYVSGSGSSGVVARGYFNLVGDVILLLALFLTRLHHGRRRDELDARPRLHFLLELLSALKATEVNDLTLCDVISMNAIILQESRS